MRPHYLDGWTLDIVSQVNCLLPSHIPLLFLKLIVGAATGSRVLKPFRLRLPVPLLIVVTSHFQQGCPQDVKSQDRDETETLQKTYEDRIVAV